MKKLKERINKVLSTKIWPLSSDIKDIKKSLVYKYKLRNIRLTENLTKVKCPEGKTWKELAKEASIYCLSCGKVFNKDKKVMEGFLKATEKDIVKGDFRTDNILHKEFNIQIF